jgi:hypothetical protein
MCYSFTVTGICTLYSLLVPPRAPKTFTKLVLDATTTTCNAAMSGKSGREHLCWDWR